MRPLGAPIVLVMLALAAPATASAATATVSGGQLLYTAGAGEQNSVSIAYQGSSLRITDNGPGVAMTAGPGCSGSAPAIDCPSSGVTSIVARLNDGNDAIAVAETVTLPTTLLGGNGNDTLTGGGGNDRLVPGNGPLNCKSSDDIEFDGATSGDDDRIAGGGGIDTVDYSGYAANPYAFPSTPQMTIYLDPAYGFASTGYGDASGCPGFESGASNDERDMITGGVENAIGTPGPDEIYGTSGANTITGGDGDDLLYGAGGGGSIDGGAGSDTLYPEIVGSCPTLCVIHPVATLAGGSGADRLDLTEYPGGLTVDLAAGRVSSTAQSESLTGIEDVDGSAGPDTLVGDDGPNRLDGKGGADHLTGAGGPDDLHGGAADDVFSARDGAVDQVACDAGDDTVTDDAEDVLSACEHATPRTTADPSVSGTAREDEVLSATTGTWSSAPSTYAYAWRRCDAAATGCEAIPGATGPAYTLVAADVGRRIRVAVTATNAIGTNTATSAPTGVVVVGPPAIGDAPALSAAPRENEVVSCSPGTWTRSPSLAFQWLEDGVAVAGATSDRLAVGAADVGRALACRVTATNAGGSATATSPAATVAPKAVAPAEAPAAAPVIVVIAAPTAPAPAPFAALVAAARQKDARLARVKATARLGRAGSTVVARLTQGRRVVGTLRRAGAGPGAVALSVPLTAKARRALARRKSVPLRLTVTVTAPAAAPVTKTAAVTLRRR